MIMKALPAYVWHGIHSPYDNIRPLLYNTDLELLGTHRVEFIFFGAIEISDMCIGIII
jgi:hypothetical protein